MVPCFSHLSSTYWVFKSLKCTNVLCALQRNNRELNTWIFTPRIALLPMGKGDRRKRSVTRRRRAPTDKIWSLIFPSIGTCGSHRLPRSPGVFSTVQTPEARSNCAPCYYRQQTTVCRHSRPSYGLESVLPSSRKKRSPIGKKLIWTAL